jgi:hypothetical protein
VGPGVEDGDVGGDRISGREDTADPVRLIRDWTIAFTGDECDDNAERWSRNHHDVHEAAKHVEIAVMVIAPFLIDRADPVLQSSGNWFDVMVFCFRHVNDDVGIEQRRRQGYPQIQQSTGMPKKRKSNLRGESQK